MVQARPAGLASIRPHQFHFGVHIAYKHLPGAQVLRPTAPSPSRTRKFRCTLGVPSIAVLARATCVPPKLRTRHANLLANPVGQRAAGSMLHPFVPLDIAACLRRGRGATAIIPRTRPKPLGMLPAGPRPMLPRPRAACASTWADCTALVHSVAQLRSRTQFLFAQAVQDSCLALAQASCTYFCRGARK